MVVDGGINQDASNGLPARFDGLISKVSGELIKVPGTEAILSEALQHCLFVVLAIDDSLSNRSINSDIGIHFGDERRIIFRPLAVPLHLHSPHLLGRNVLPRKRQNKILKQSLHLHFFVKDIAKSSRAPLLIGKIQFMEDLANMQQQAVMSIVAM